MRDLQLAIEEIGLSGSVSLGNCSVRTLQRWCKNINEILETERYDWRVCVDKEEMCLRVKDDNININAMTVEELSIMFTRIVSAGYGSMVFCIGDDVVCKDNYCIDYLNNKFSIRGHLYNMEDYEKLRKFKDHIDKAWKELHY